jgi:hypothetical protein
MIRSFVERGQKGRITQERNDFAVTPTTRKDKGKMSSRIYLEL